MRNYDWSGGQHYIDIAMYEPARSHEPTPTPQKRCNMICVASSPLERQARSDGFVAASLYESRRSPLRLCFSLFVCFSVFAALAEPQIKPVPTSSIETIAGGEPTSVLGTEFSLASVSGLAGDADGNIYFSIQSRNRVYRLGPDGNVAAFAGNGVRQESLEGVSAASSPLLDPRTLAVDAAGNVYIVCANALVRVDGKTGLLTTVFSIPYGQPGAPDSIRDILQMVVGPDGDLYLSDSGDHRIKTYDFASGAVTVLAGNGTSGPTQPGVAAISSPLRYPQAVAVGADGTVYFSTEEPCVFRITPSGRKLQVINIALPEEHTPLGEYDIPHYISLDEQGHLFVAQANRSRVLRIVLKTGAVSTYAGTGAQGFNGDDIKADRANVTGPDYVLSDAAGNLTIAELFRIRSVDSSTRLISTKVGNGHAVLDGTTTVALGATLWEPANALPAADGSVYITSTFDNRLLRLDRDGKLTTAAGGGAFVTRGSQPGSSTEVALILPQGIWLGKNDEVFFSDDDNRIIRRLSADGSEVTNFATTPKAFHSFSGILQSAAALVADENSFYLSDPTGRCVWRISRTDGKVELFVGTPPDRHGPAGGSAAERLAGPSGLALDSAGNLYVADGYLGGKNGRILRVDGATRSIATVLSNLQQPSGLAFQWPEVLCFSESGAHQVRCLNLDSHSITVVAGTGEAGYSGDGGPAECAQLNRPSGISFGKNGDLYIADTGNQRIRRVRFGSAQARCHP